MSYGGGGYGARNGNGAGYPGAYERSDGYSNGGFSNGYPSG